MMALQACDTLKEEHQIMLGLLKKLERLVLQPETLEEAQAVFQRIQGDIAVHFPCEEWVLFPMMAPHRSMVLMEVEHDEIFRRRDAVWACLSQEAPDIEALQATTTAFIQYLRTHIQEEDDGVFPFCETRLNPAEKQRVIDGMARLRTLHQRTPLPPIRRAQTGFTPIAAPAPFQPGDKPLQIKTLAEGQLLQIKRLSLKQGQFLAEHWSPHQVVLVCQSGHLTFRAKDCQQPLRTGESLLLTPRLYYALTAEEDSSVLMFFQELRPDRLTITGEPPPDDGFGLYGMVMQNPAPE